MVHAGPMSDSHVNRSSKAPTMPPARRRCCRLKAWPALASARKPLRDHRRCNGGAVIGAEGSTMQNWARTSSASDPTPSRSLQESKHRAGERRTAGSRANREGLHQPGHGGRPPISAITPRVHVHPTRICRSRSRPGRSSRRHRARHGPPTSGNTHQTASALRVAQEPSTVREASTWATGRDASGGRRRNDDPEEHRRSHPQQTADRQMVEQVADAEHRHHEPHRPHERICP